MLSSFVEEIATRQTTQSFTQTVQSGSLMPSMDLSKGFGQAKVTVPSSVRNSVCVTADELSRPNGICFSPDEKIIYIIDTD